MVLKCYNRNYRHTQLCFTFKATSFPLTVYGFYNNIWGMDILALEPVGEAVSEDEKITPAFYGTYPTQLLHQHTTVCL